MTALTLPKSYGDLELLFKSDVDEMWDDLEAFTNGNINSDNVNVGWATFAQIELQEDMDFYLGDAIILRFEDDTLYFLFDDVNRDVDFYINTVSVAQIDESGTFTTALDVYTASNINYPISTFMNYSKPVLVYTDSTTVSMQQNVTTANRSLIIFPSGPVDVTEDISSTHKFRQLKISAVANGYLAAHTGAADSGMKVGLSLTENTWYFVYAVIVQGGDDLGKFVMVVDDGAPLDSRIGEIDTAFGSGQWVYLGSIRYGFGEAATTTLVPFVMDHQGWTHFVGGAETDNFFGIRLTSTVVSTTAYDTIWQEQTGNEGESIPATFSCAKITYRPVDSLDTDMTGQMVLTDSEDNILQLLPSFSVLLDPGEAHGFECKIPTGLGIKLKGRIGA